MAMKIPGPKKPETGTLLGNATSVSPEWCNIPKQASPNWRKWSNMATVELWEAIALSLNIEPAYNLQGTAPEFDSRMAVALSHLGTGGELEAIERNSPLHCSRVRLRDVARLAASCVPAWVLPGEFPKPFAAPVKAQPAESSGTPENGEQAQVQPEKQLITGVDRNKILAHFPPPNGTTAANWSKALSAPPKWLADARIFKGKASVSALWNPAMFAMAYAEKGIMTKQNLTAIIRSEFTRWLPEWEKYTSSFD